LENTGGMCHGTNGSISVGGPRGPLSHSRPWHVSLAEADDNPFAVVVGLLPEPLFGHLFLSSGRYAGERGGAERCEPVTQSEAGRLEAVPQYSATMTAFGFCARVRCMPRNAATSALGCRSCSGRPPIAKHTLMRRSLYIDAICRGTFPTRASVHQG